MEEQDKIQLNNSFKRIHSQNINDSAEANTNLSKNPEGSLNLSEIIEARSKAIFSYVQNSIFNKDQFPKKNLKGISTLVIPSYLPNLKRKIKKITKKGKRLQKKA